MCTLTKKGEKSFFSNQAYVELAINFLMKKYNRE